LRHADLPVIGWREWLALPSLGIQAVKAKVDTGARSSSLHAFDVEIYTERGAPRARFKVHPFQRDTNVTITADAELVDQRRVRSSGGHDTVRPVILTLVELLGQCWPIELTLASRDAMGFRMLLGRQAIRARFLVDPSRSYFAGKYRRRAGRGRRRTSG
jgi:hypothetical protein